MPQPTFTRAHMLAELGAVTCQCGAAKLSRQTFCRTCYRKLPTALRTRLYRRFGEGYEEAYGEAMATLHPV